MYDESTVEPLNEAANDQSTYWRLKVSLGSLEQP